MLSAIAMIWPPVWFLSLHKPWEIMWVNGESMSPLLNTNHSPELPNAPDKILVRRFLTPDSDSEEVPTSQKDFRRGQIVVFEAPHDPSRIAVKRVVGVGGDLITPLPGYPGGDGPQVVPYNHLWVEGDVDNRDKSLDSNWYGPISAALVIGIVTMLLTPWYSPTSIEWKKHKYPAKEQGRVQTNAVQSAMVDPNEAAMDELFQTGWAERLLQSLKAFPERAVENIKASSADRGKYQGYYDRVKRTLESQPAGSRGADISVSQELVDTLEKIFVDAGLNKEGYSPQQLKSMKKDKRKARKSYEEWKKEKEQVVEEIPKDEGPAARQLREMLQQRKKEMDVEEARMLKEHQKRWAFMDEIKKKDNETGKEATAPIMTT